MKSEVGKSNSRKIQNLVGWTGRAGAGTGGDLVCRNEENPTSRRYEYLKLPCRRRRLGTLDGARQGGTKAWLGIIDLLGGGCTKGPANSTPGRWCIYPAPSSDRVSPEMGY